MLVLLRRFGAGILGVAALIVFVQSSSLGQQAPPPPAAAPQAVAPAAQPAAPAQPPAAPNPNVYVNPQATAGRFPNNTAVLGQTLKNAATNTAPTLPGYNSDSGYGTLAASYANPTAGYGSLVNSGAGAGAGYGVGGYGMYGMGFATQWMMNPYSGYMRGAADITRANADYQVTIQKAKLLRQEAIRSSIQTRRAFLEEAEYERAHAPDPEKIRQKLLARELDRARAFPPADDIFTARALNALLRHLINQQTQGIKAEHNVPLNEDTLSHVNLTVGDNRGNVGLLRDNGKLQWPLPLQREAFKEPRDRLNALMKEAYRSVSSGNLPPDNVLNDLLANFDLMQKALDANLDTLTFDEQIEARRYLRYVKNTLIALRDPNVVNHFNGNWAARVKSVAELVKYMSEKGLWFAGASPTDEPAYRSLYYSLSSFDAQMPRVASSGSDSGQ